MYTTGALSVIDSDDDYCISYIVTMVDVRSCARPPRSHDQQHISQMSTPPRSLDQTYINEYTRQQKSLCPQSSASVGELYHHCMCMIHIDKLHL